MPAHPRVLKGGRCVACLIQDVSAQDPKGLTTRCTSRQDPHFIVLLSVVAALVPYNAVVLFKNPEDYGLEQKREDLMNRIENQVAIVTGGAKGIGKAIASGLLEQRVKVVICARNKVEVDRSRTRIGRQRSDRRHGL